MLLLLLGLVCCYILWRICLLYGDVYFLCVKFVGNQQPQNFPPSRILSLLKYPVSYSFVDIFINTVHTEFHIPRFNQLHICIFRNYVWSTVYRIKKINCSGTWHTIMKTTSLSFYVTQNQSHVSYMAPHDVIIMKMRKKY
jgi:hypothetical protein